MQVNIVSVESVEEEAATIKAVEITKEIQSAIDILENESAVIPVTCDGEIVLCKTNRIYYFESIDKKTFVYTKDGCYETKLRLYELDMTMGRYFCRCSKSMIVNIRKIDSVKSELNGRMRAKLLNGEQVIIARSYVKDLKEKLGIG